MKEKITGISDKKPMPVTLIHEGERYRAMGGGGGGPSRVWLKDKNNQVINPATEEGLSGLSASTPYIYNVSIIDANTEYSQALPSGTKSFKIYAVNSVKDRVHRGVLKYCFTEGASGETLIPIPSGNYNEVFNLNLIGKTLYFQSSIGSAVAIIVAYT